MLGQGAAVALGIDPTRLFIAQFNALKRYGPEYPAFVLPLKSEQFLADRNAGYPGFDTVFSMGILYHRRDPVEHIQELVDFVRPGGELIIETLVVDGNEDAILNPAARYAKMRNVWSIPSVLALEAWCQQSGLVDIELIDVSKTTANEQRATEWMEFESLTDFLDPEDSNRTIEGHPAPQRAIMLCRRLG
jgi:tRNA (mo5U34)-methyltransferase